MERILDRIAERDEHITKLRQELLEAQRRYDERFNRVDSDIANMKGNVDERFNQVDSDIANLKGDVKDLKDDVGHLKGDSLERKYRDKAPSYFGRLVRKPKVVDINRLWNVLESHLSEEELNDVLLLDLIVQGKHKDRTLDLDLYLALEVSAVVDRNDVARVQRRAALLRKAGFNAIPVVAGDELTTGAEQEAQTHHVAIVRNGNYALWEEALSANPST